MTWWWSGVVVAVSALIFGSVYWTQDHRDLDIGAIGLALYLVAMVPVAVLRATRTAPFLLAAATLPAGLVLAVVVRIAVDVMGDPSSHNLWPFEVVIAAVVGGFWGLLAAGVGELALRTRTR